MCHQRARPDGSSVRHPSETFSCRWHWKVMKAKTTRPPKAHRAVEPLSAKAVRHPGGAIEWSHSCDTRRDLAFVRKSPTGSIRPRPWQAYFHVPEMAVHKRVELDAFLTRGSCLIGCGNGFVGGILKRMTSIEELQGVDPVRASSTTLLRMVTAVFLARRRTKCRWRPPLSIASSASA